MRMNSPVTKINFTLKRGVTGAASMRQMTAALHQNGRLIVSVSNGNVWTTQSDGKIKVCKATTFWDVTPYSLVERQQYHAGDKDTSSSYVRYFAGLHTG
jgi:hypothetical protein